MWLTFGNGWRVHITTTTTDASAYHRIMTILSKATNEIAQGEVLQLLNCQNAALTEEQYYQVIKRCNKVAV
jgi:geranylgeranyl pyrophosphate synthase